MWSTNVDVGVLFTQSDRRRHEVAIDEALREATLRTLAACHDLVGAGSMPPPVADQRCARCSVSEACGVRMPDLASGVAYATQPEGEW